jgi:hypothetical protein
LLRPVISVEHPGSAPVATVKWEIAANRAISA